MPRVEFEGELPIYRVSCTVLYKKIVTKVSHNYSTVGIKQATPLFR